jgi:four helix bundle protein
MIKENVVRDKSLRFAVRIVNFVKTLKEERKEFIICNQVLRSGTSVGANVREALNAESIVDFAHKLGIAQKECDETCYWLELLRETEYINEIEYNSIYNDATELLKIIRSIIISTKKKIKEKNNS